MTALRTYISTFITSGDVVDIVMAILAVLALGIIIKILCFGLYDRK